jgi:hypothetical protein
MKDRTWVAFVLVFAMAGCNVSDGSTTPKTLPPLGAPSNTAPPTTATPGSDTDTGTGSAGTGAGAGSQPIVAPTTIALPAGACVFSAPVAASPSAVGEVTFEAGTRLYSANPDGGAVSCLAELAADNVGPLQWSPAADRVLLNAATVFDGTQAKPTGYLTTNAHVTWSFPTGKALVAPAVADNHLLWRTTGEPATRRDISFLARTDVAAYHPAGKNIFAAGQASDGSAGLFLAGNRGENPRVIAKLDDPNTAITEIAPDPSGARVFFVHDHKNGIFHVHALDLPALGLVDITQATEPVAKLTVGATPSSSIAWRIGDCSGLTRTQTAGPGATIVGDQPAVFVSMSTEPVGWVDSQRLVVMTRTTGCTGPGDLWIWNIANQAASLLMTGVDTAAVRSPLASFGELPGDINSTAPG